MKRRDFIKNTAAVATLPIIPIMTTTIKPISTPEKLLKKYLPVNFTRDGLNISPTLYANLLAVLTQQEGFQPDSYGLGGMIHAFEEKVAKALGKEKAIYIPSGTLANHLALRRHCTTKKRAIVQYNSHINSDSGDCATTLSGINLITLGMEESVFKTTELKRFLGDNQKGKVKTPIGLLSLETPIRRQHLERIPFKTLEKLTKLAKNNAIATHLDGARLYIDAAFSGHRITEYTKLFDTVYVSMYKSFNSVSGAILAGSKAIINDLHHERRMFGAGLPSSWQQIAIANYFFDGYEARYQKAINQFKTFKKILENTGNYKITSLKNGSNVFKLTLYNGIHPTTLKENLIKNNILFPKWNEASQCFFIKMNDSLVYHNMEKLAAVFI